MFFIGNITIVLSQQTELLKTPDTGSNKPKILETDSSGFAINYTMTFSKNDFSLNTLQGFDTVQLYDGGYTTEIGKPMIPVKNIRMAIPAEMKVSTIEILDIKEEPLDGTYLIFPTQTPLPVDSTLKENQFIKPDYQTYISHQPYPSKLIEFIGQSDLAGQVMVDITIYPIHYIPNEKKLTLVTSITFNIIGTKGYVCGDYLSTRISECRQNLCLRSVQNMVVNPEAVALQFSLTPQPAGVNPGDYDYVIITQDSWVSAFQPLADWKTKKGIPTNIVTTSWIYNSGGYSGSNVDKIRAFVLDVYTNWGTIYVLLGGDVDVVPCHYRTFSQVDPDLVPNDVYYADYDGDWICEVNVGRASVTGPGSGTGQIGNFINKVLTYETNPPLTNYAKNAAFFGFDLDSTTYGEQCKINIDNTYIPSSWSMTTVYDSQSGNHRTNVIAALNVGPNLVNHVDHCNSGYLGTGYVNHNLGLSNYDMDALTNGNKQTIMYSQGCDPAAFDVSNCIAEHFVRDNNGGGIAFIGNSRYGWYNYGQYNTLSMRYDVNFFKSLFQENLYHLGAAFTDHKNDGIQSQPGNELYRYLFTGLTLLGDPELPIWTENPTSLSVTHPDQLLRDSSSFTITVTSNGNPVSQSYVCLWKENEVYLTGYTNTNGVITFHPSPTTIGTMFITVTKQNYLPYEGSATVVNQPPISDFTYSPINPITTDTIQFTDTSTDSDGTVISWSWTFGDGTTSNIRNPQHQYADDGTYLVVLNVIDNDGAENTRTKSINVSNVPPFVNFTHSPFYPLTSDTILFNDTSTDIDGTIISWLWRFGDGSSSTLQSPSHKYDDNGVYTVTLNVTDDDDAFESKSISISVSNVPPSPDFNYLPSNPITTDTIQFTDTSTDSDGTIVSWFWRFGDGSTSAQQNPLYKYSDNGDYTIILNITDDDGAKNAKTKSISVSNAPPAANFSFEPINPTTQETVFFNSTSYDSDGVLSNYTWDFVDGNFSYEQKTTHMYSDNGTYLITLNVTDNDGDTDTIQKTIQVSPNYPPNTPNDPSPTNDASNIPLFSTLSWTSGDPNMDSLTYDVYFGMTSPPDKVKSNQSDTTYDPGTMNFTITYYWKVVAWDTHGVNATSPTWHFTTRTNHPPVAVPDSFSTNEDTTLSVSAPGVLGNDEESDNDIMTAIKVSNTIHGTVTLNSNGSFSYIPIANYYGIDTFTYKAYDGFVYSPVENVTITIHSVNDPPVLGTSSPGNGSTVNKLSLTWSIPITDIEGDLFSWTIQCNNGQTNISTGANNGTKTLFLSGLAYSTTYKIWVNATDPTGSDQFIRKWYTITP
ncbi:MAG TPA: PKD domain-containing protein, partial [Candidatus Thermoplasmatota archaeon]|nr:PKD domain-containing protein [Candidatus Thermoplasmatota archaeon]